MAMAAAGGGQADSDSNATARTTELEQGVIDSGTTISLAERVQALPPELFNRIQDCTFTATSGEVDIFDDSLPPSCLQVSHDTRQKYAESYYPNTIFYIASDLVQAWFSSLEYIDFQELMIICYPPIRCKDVEGDHVCTRICDEYDALTPWLGDDDSFEEAIKFEVVYKEPGERDKKTWLTVRDVKDAKSNGWGRSVSGIVWYKENFAKMTEGE